MPSNNETKNKLNEGVSNIEFFREEITSLRVSLEKQKVKRKTKRRLKFFIKKLMRRKLKEAFPRKEGKYNEIFQDKSKESWTNDNKAALR